MMNQMLDFRQIKQELLMMKTEGADFILTDSTGRGVRMLLATCWNRIKQAW